MPEQTLEEIGDSPTGRPRKHEEYAIAVEESVYVFGEAMHSEDAVWADEDAEDPESKSLGRVASVVDAVTPGASMEEIRRATQDGGGPPVDAETGADGDDAAEDGDDGDDGAVGTGDAAASSDGPPEDASGTWSVFRQIAQMAEDARSVDEVLEEEDVIVSERESTPMFLISDYSEKRLIDKGLAGGLAFIVIGVVVVGIAGFVSISWLT